MKKLTNEKKAITETHHTHCLNPTHIASMIERYRTALGRYVRALGMNLAVPKRSKLKTITKPMVKNISSHSHSNKMPVAFNKHWSWILDCDLLSWKWRKRYIWATPSGNPLLKWPRSTKKITPTIGGNHLECNKKSWKNVIFIDEKKLNVDAQNGFHYYWHYVRKETEIVL